MALLHDERVLDINTDCAEFCPHPEHLHVLAVAAYQLDEATQQRVGRLSLFATGACDSAYKLQEVASKDEVGIFDAKWRCSGTGMQLGLALADGSLALVDVLHQEDGSYQLQQHSSCQAVTDAMALFLDWQPTSSSRSSSATHESSSQPTSSLQTEAARDHPSSTATPGGDAGADDAGSTSSSPAPEAAEPSGASGASSGSSEAVISSSGGDISRVKLREAGMEVVDEWQAHDLEAWAAVYDLHQPSIIYSGADDASFKGWDMRAPARSPAFVNRRAHGAGVCIVSGHPEQQHLLCTGSYDDHIRLWDSRLLQRPLMTHEVNTGGGNWRLKWCPHDRHLLLAACMYNGFAVLRADDSYSSLSLAEEYKGHGSIAYGADWFRGQPGSGSAAGRCLVATCSFYDRLLHLWSPDTRAGVA